VTNKEKLQEAIELALLKLSLNTRVQNNYRLNNGFDRFTLAEHLSEALVSDDTRYRSGRRISDAVKDKLLDLQRWVVKKMP
jgi:hypothetical protein